MNGAVHPRAVAAWSAAALTAALLTNNPVQRAAVLLVAANICVALRRPEARLRPIVLGLTAASVLAIIVNILASHDGTTVITTLPAGIPLIGGPLTLEGAASGVGVALGISAAMLSASAIAFLLEADELVDALPRGLERTGAALGGALSVIPRLMRTATEIRDVQRVRGWTSQRREPLRSILVPAFLTAIEDSVQLAETMEARGFGSARRTSWPSRGLQPADIAVITAAALAVAVSVWARFSGVVSDWYPLPSLTLPPASFATVVIALFLMTPLVVSRR